MSDQLEVKISVDRELAKDIVSDGHTAEDMIYYLGRQVIEQIAELFDADE